MKGRFGVWYLRLCQWLARHRLWRPGKIMYIGGSDVLPAPLSREEEGELIARLAEGDQAASSTLIEHNLRLVVYIARIALPLLPLSQLRLSALPSPSEKNSIPQPHRRKARQESQYNQTVLSPASQDAMPEIHTTSLPHLLPCTP